MHLIGYLYEDYHDARSLEHKVPHLMWPWWLLTKSHCRHHSPHFRRQLPLVTDLRTRTCLTLICIVKYTHQRDFRLLEWLTIGDGNNRSYRNVGTVPVYAAQIPRRAQISHTQHPFTDKLIYKRIEQTHGKLFYLSFNQQSEYKAFYKLMCWLAGWLGV